MVITITLLKINLLFSYNRYKKYEKEAVTNFILLSQSRKMIG